MPGLGALQRDHGPYNRHENSARPRENIPLLRAAVIELMLKQIKRRFLIGHRNPSSGGWYSATLPRTRIRRQGYALRLEGRIIHNCFPNLGGHISKLRADEMFLICAVCMRLLVCTGKLTHRVRALPTLRTS